MKATFVAVALAGLAAAQDFDFDAILNAPSPSATGVPITAVTADSTTTDSASVAASISSDVTTVATAEITGASASAASTQTPTGTDLEKRDWKSTSTTSTTSKKSTTSTVKTSTSTVKSTSTSSVRTSTSSSKSSTSTSSVPSTLVTSTSTTQQTTGTTTTSSDTSCPTVPEAGTYCGFINPEDPCAPQPDGYGPKVQPDTVDAFMAYPEFHQDAQKAVTPKGYQNVFKDLNASTSANSYITFYTLDSYNTTECAAYCDDTDLCTAFNIYIERDPSLNPTENGDASNSTGEWCPNPSSITNYKCSLWGSSIDNTTATNAGGWRDDFQVVIVGSNGYDKTNQTTPVTPPGWTAPTNCTGGINKGGSYHMGSCFFPGPFDPFLCGVYGQAQTATNKQAAQKAGQSSYVPCNYFNSYMVKKNGVAQGTYCSLFNTVLNDAYAGFEGAWSGNDFFGIESSWSFQLGQLDSGKF